MGRRALATGFVITLVATAGCLGALESPDQAASTASSTAADVRLSSVGQSAVDGGQAVEVSGSVRNYGDVTTSVNATVTLLNDSTEVTERTASLGSLAPDESASFTLTLNVSAGRVDGRTITFD